MRSFDSDLTLSFSRCVRFVDLWNYAPTHTHVIHSSWFDLLIFFQPALVFIFQYISVSLIKRSFALVGADNLMPRADWMERRQRRREYKSLCVYMVVSKRNLREEIRVICDESDQKAILTQREHCLDWVQRLELFHSMLIQPRKMWTKTHFHVQFAWNAHLFATGIIFQCKVLCYLL
jgi:hypothetical protein